MANVSKQVTGVEQTSFDVRQLPTSDADLRTKLCAHLYANANEACGTEANQNECQKVVCLAFA